MRWWNWEGVARGKRLTLSVTSAYNSFWIVTEKKKRSFQQFGLDKGFLYGSSSRDAIAITGDKFNLLTEHLLSHGHSSSTDLRETKVAVAVSIPKKLLLGSKALHWAQGN